ncbi:MAG: GtrA family protein [Proteobacteria bacterium]|nr:GtrA family protein [Pseudomonadota bacterium]
MHALTVLRKKRFVRFLLVGALNTFFGYACFAAFLYAGLHYILALLAATVIGVAFNFKTIGALVFDSRANHLIFRFVACYGVVYAVNALLLTAFQAGGLHSPLVGQAVLVLPMAIFSYTLNRRYVFLHG